MNKEKCINEPLNNIYKIIHYKKNEKNLYLFCGKIEKEIENSIVNFIYKNNTSSDNDILIKKFGKNYKNVLGLNLGINENNFFIIQKLIYNIYTVKELKENIFYYLNDKFNNKINKYLFTEHQYIWKDNEMITHSWYDSNNNIVKFKNYNPFNEDEDDNNVKNYTLFNRNDIVLYDLLKFNNTFNVVDYKDISEYKYIKKYFPDFELYKNINQARINNIYNKLLDKVIPEKYTIINEFEQIDLNKNLNIIFGKCNISSMIIHTYHDKNIEFDLFNIFEQIKLNKDIVFARYRHDKEPYFKIWEPLLKNKIIDEKKYDEWISNKINIRSLSLRVKIDNTSYEKENNITTPHFATITILSKTNILEVKFKPQNNTYTNFIDIDNYINTINNAIKKINKLIFTIPESGKKIYERPKLNTIDNKFYLQQKNKKNELMSISLHYNFKAESLDYKKLNKLASKFEKLNFLTKNESKSNIKFDYFYTNVSNFRNIKDDFTENLLKYADDDEELKQQLENLIDINKNNAENELNKLNKEIKKGKISTKKGNENLDKAKEELNKWKNWTEQKKQQKIEQIKNLKKTADTNVFKLNKGVQLQISGQTKPFSIYIKSAYSIKQLIYATTFLKNLVLLYINKNDQYDYLNEIIKNYPNKNFEERIDIDDKLIDYSDPIDQKIMEAVEDTEFWDVDIYENIDEIDENIDEEEIPVLEYPDWYSIDGWNEEARTKKILNTLRDADPEVFNPTYPKGTLPKDKYATACTGSQPMVIEKSKKTELDKWKNEDIIKDYTLYRDKYYFCPKYWCPIERKPKLSKQDLCEDGNQPIHSLADGKKRYTHISYMTKKHPNNLCYLCCKASPVNLNELKSKYTQRWNQCAEQIELETEDNIKQSLYFNSENNYPLKKNSLGYLPINIHNLFNNQENANFVTKKDYPINNFKGWIRNGIKNNKKNSFLEAISYIWNNNGLYKNLTGEKLRTEIIPNYLNDNPRIFNTLRSGLLKIMFETQENFIECLKSDNELKDEWLIDVVSRKNVLNKDGFNIFIIKETNNDFYLDCPYGENVNSFYKKNKPIILLYTKIENVNFNKIYYFEPIIYLEKTSKIKFIMNFDIRNFNIIKELENKYLKDCKNEFDKQQIEYLKQTASTYNFTFEKPIQAPLFKELNKSFENSIEGQFVDNYNKLSGLLIKGVLVPTFPEGQIEGLKILNEIPLKNYDTVINFYKELNEKNFKITIVSAVADSIDSNNIIALQLNTGDNIPIKPIEYTTKEQFGIEKSNYMTTKYYKDIDEKINTEDINETQYKVLQNINRKKYITEMFERLKLEISYYLNVQETKGLSNIKNILNITNSNEFHKLDINDRKSIEELINQYKSKINELQQKNKKSYDKIKTFKEENNFEKILQQRKEIKNRTNILEKYRKEIRNRILTIIKPKKQLLEEIFEKDLSIEEQREEVYNILKEIFPKVVYTIYEDESNISWSIYRPSNRRDVCYLKVGNTCEKDPHCIFIGMSKNTFIKEKEEKITQIKKKIEQLKESDDDDEDDDDDDEEDDDDDDDDDDDEEIELILLNIQKKKAEKEAKKAEKEAKKAEKEAARKAAEEEAKKAEEEAARKAAEEEEKEAEEEAARKAEEEEEKEVSKKEMINTIIVAFIKKYHKKLIDVNKLRLHYNDMEDKELKKRYKKVKNTYNKKGGNSKINKLEIEIEEINNMSYEEFYNKYNKKERCKLKFIEKKKSSIIVGSEQQFINRENISTEIQNQEKYLSVLADLLVRNKIFRDDFLNNRMSRYIKVGSITSNKKDNLLITSEQIDEIKTQYFKDNVNCKSNIDKVKYI